MEWLTEHFHMVVPITIFLLYMFREMLSRKEGEGEAPPTETDEEARRIQEEIRRKIIARQRGEDSAPPPMPGQTTPPPAGFPRRGESTPPPLTSRQRREEQPIYRQTAPVAAVRDYSAELRAQQERLREAKKAREDALRSAGATGSRPHDSWAIPTQGSNRALRTGLQKDLSSAASLKRAFVLKEVLDQPVGLRARSDVFTPWG